MTVQSGQNVLIDGRRPDDVWARISAPVPAASISWRQDGKATARDGKYFARFVCYIEANTVRERLDSVVPGEWDLTLELMPSLASMADVEGLECAFKARLQILGVIRENVGSGKDYKSAATDAFKRAAVRFGIGSELYDFEQNWVEVDSDSKYAKAVEDPQKAYERRHGSGAKSAAATQASPAPREGAAPEQTGGQTSSGKKSLDEKTMPFGKTKGQRLIELSDSELESSIAWCRKTDAKKFVDLIADMTTVLDSRTRHVDPDDVRGSLEAADEAGRDLLPF